MDIRVETARILARKGPVGKRDDVSCYYGSLRHPQQKYQTIHYLPPTRMTSSKSSKESLLVCCPNVLKRTLAVDSCTFSCPNFSPSFYFRLGVCLSPVFPRAKSSHVKDGESDYELLHYIDGVATSAKYQVNFNVRPTGAFDPYRCHSLLQFR